MKKERDRFIAANKNKSKAKPKQLDLWTLA